MATKKKKDENNRFNGLVSVKKIWSALTPGQWISMLNSLAPEYGWQLKGTTIAAKCPYHHDTDPSFRLQPLRGFGKCFGSCGKHVHDVVELVKHLKKCSYTEALLYLVNEYKLTGILTTDANDLTKYHQVQEMKKEAAVAFNEVLMEFIRDEPEHLKYLAPAAAYLFKGRKIPLEVAHTLPVGVFAKPEHVKRHMRTASLHGLYDTYFGETLKNAERLWGSIIFHYNNSTGSISTFKCRKLEQDNVVAAAMKVPWREMDEVTAKTLYSHEFEFLPDPYATGRGVFGLHYYNRIVGRESADAYVTEGEFDALSVMAAQAKEGRQDFMMLAAGGNSNDISFLSDLDIKYIWLVQDHPAKQGDGFAIKLLEAHNDAKKTKNGATGALQFKIFQWPASIVGMDLDDAVQMNSYMEMFNYLYVKRNEYFLNSTPWVTSKCDAELAALKDTHAQEVAKLVMGERSYDVAKSNLDDDLRTKQHSVLLRWVSCLPDATEKAAFARKYDVELGIDITKTSEVHTSMYSLDTMEGCVDALRTELKSMFSCAYYETKNTGNLITLWSKHRHETIPVANNSIDKVISQYGEGDVMEWAQRILKDAPYTMMEDASIGSSRKLLANLTFLTERAVNGLIHEARPLASLAKVGQGIHYDILPSSAKLNGYLYFVNGTKVFRGKYDKDTGKLNWEFLNNIVDGNIIFKLCLQDKWSFVSDVADLDEATQVDLKELFADILKIVDGWRFESHEVMREYIAAWILSLPIQRACGKVNLTFVTGDSNSGKTSFARGLLGGTSAGGHEVKSILEPVVFRSDATAAAMYQEMDASGLMFTIDEAETSETHNTKHDERIKEIQRMIYSVPHGGHSISRGGVTMDQKVQYSLQMPVLMCGINMNKDTVFLSRIVVIYTHKEANRKNIGDYIDGFFSQDRVELIRRHVTLALLPHIPEIKRIQIDLQRELAEIQHDKISVTGRFIECFLLPLAVYKFLGFDPIELFKKIVLVNKHMLVALEHDAKKMDLIHTVLYSKTIRMNSDDGFNLQDPRTLIMTGEINYLNSANVGVYYYRPKNWIIIVWRMVKHNLLKNNAQYKDYDETSLAEHCTKSSFVVNDITALDHRNITKEFTCPDVKSKSGYTVVKAEYILDNFDTLTAFPDPEPEKVDADIEKDIVLADPTFTAPSMPTQRSTFRI